ncbi:hypothetical protein CARUB_v10018746mg [Capsella rubella]|uniref:Uncharacterized protein n=1 Tax=Capsella rubella TaxID=81985 RepID=R0H7X1_9BRAS|nr:hypothetical protein CARUB_v10018746mg [Capsella rubella]
METMKVETFANEIIKPSSNTPNNLNTLQLSIYDHIIPPVYTVAFLFYTNDELISPEHCSNKLKTSLSETLTKFYPLAGRINGVTIDCNDEGAIFVDARVNNCPLSNFLGSPDFKAIQQLLPLEVIDNPNEAANTWPILLVKATYFPCGEGESLVDPAFAAANFYPPASPFFQLPLDENANKISKITKRFVFGSSKLEELRVKAATADVVAKPTRVESVTALLWKAFVASSSTNTSDTKILIQPANLRPKIPSFLPENLIGNVMFSSAVLSVSRGENVKIEEAIKDLRKKKEDLGVVIKDEDGSTSLKIGAKLANLMLGKFAMLSYETHQPYTVSSWCKLPLYEASFGWGSPVWVVGNVAPMLDNVTMLMDSKDGQGIEALVTLPEENMMCFEQNTELLAYASMNPSVLVE